MNLIVTHDVENFVDFPKEQFISEKISLYKRTAARFITEKLPKITPNLNYPNQ